MLKKTLKMAGVVAAVALAVAAGANMQNLNAGENEKVTICHAAGRDGTTHYVEITVGWPAAYGPAGHFYENGTPQAGHEDDYLGPCKKECEKDCK